MKQSLVLIGLALFVVLVWLCKRSNENFTQDNLEMCVNGCYGLYHIPVYNASKQCNAQYPEDTKKQEECFDNSSAVKAMSDCNKSCAAGCH